ncbi:hypothetical protein GCM10009668_00460 [Nocardioides dubius]|uniref:Uncharacterized protein n=1 Tax=Nocardioides dubius TaxID=317019 RepID=A0ABP4E5W5_9ACTN
MFGDEPTTPEPVAQSTAPPASDWQIDLLRKALDARGLTSMVERQTAIEAAGGRKVPSLRSLTQEEALAILNQFGQEPQRRSSSGSAWDDRDEDTWIDPL